MQGGIRDTHLCFQQKTVAVSFQDDLIHIKHGCTLCIMILNQHAGNDLIREYFFLGYTYSEILLILFDRHAISIRFVSTICLIVLYMCSFIYYFISVT